MIPFADSKSPRHTVQVDYNPEDGLAFSVEACAPLVIVPAVVEA